MTKKILAIFIFILLLALVLVACDEEKDLGTDAITTSKSGTVEVGVYSADEVTKGKANGYTPGVSVDEKDITDDGKGLYRIIFDTSGEGTVSVASTTVQTGDSVTVQAGTSVTVNVTPATDWKLNVCMLDWEVVQSNTFVMPEHDVTFLVSFVSKRHSISLGGSGGGYIITEGSEAVEETTVEFSINEADLEAYWYYYEDEDVFVESSVEDETGNRERVNVQKVGENRFRFVMPAFDCNIVMNKREFGKVDGVYFSKRNNANGQLNQIDENEIANYITYTLTMDNETIELNTRIKRHVATLNITYLNPLYEVEDVRWDSRTNSTTKVDDTHYTFTVGYSHLVIILKDKEVPSGSHTITVNNSEHGTVSAPAYAEQNDQVTVTVTPDDEYRLVTLQYSYENDVWNDITLQDGAYVFTMPDAEVTLRATFDNTPETTGVLRVCVANVVYEGDEYSLTEVVDQLGLAVNGSIVEIGDLVDNMTINVELGQELSMGIWMKEGFSLEMVSFHNEDVTTNKGNFGAAYFLIGEDDLNCELVIVFNVIY